ncbi:hypothetical protein SCATT_p04370 (plasmid) [Streptantibioticus cattleyicolor NRRL 8057 = DSM 46488]|uniref:DUF6545 domain-containing protein n=2 Tax=Streptantibioticus cattleyicolor TaxID=29303 RepID=G8XFZ1_STREN|nr:hypothetical protein SCATT_p04370 [Streptantibioticus cattleyicolor NRRL 8057 = DSM 46488]
MLIIGSVWKLVDLARAPHDRLLRTLVACLLMLTAGELLSYPQASHAVDEVTAVGVGKVAFNAVYMAGLCALILFFHSCMRGERARYRRQFRFNTALLAGVVAVLTAAVVVTPAPLRGHTLSTPHMARPSIACFYLVGNAYFLYAYVTSALCAVRYARLASRHLALGLWTAALGLFGLAVTSVGRMVWVFLRIDRPGSHQAFNTVNWSVADWSMGVVLVGISYSAGVQLCTHLRSTLHHRRMYEELTPLWTALAAAYPELVLKREPVGSRFRLRRTHERFYRRLIECRDALVRLSPYLTRVAPGADLARGPADQLARYISEALRLKPATEDPDTAYSAAPVAFPARNDVEADARELIAISLAYAKGNREQAADPR